MPADTSLRSVVAFQNRASIDITFLLSTEAAKKPVDFIDALPRSHRGSRRPKRYRAIRP